MTPEPGYKIGRDDQGFTKREREVVDRIMQGKNLVEIGREIGVSKQRVDQIVNALIKKERIRRTADHFEVILLRT